MAKPHAQIPRPDIDGELEKMLADGDVRPQSTRDDQQRWGSEAVVSVQAKLAPLAWVRWPVPVVVIATVIATPDQPGMVLDVITTIGAGADSVEVVEQFALGAAGVTWIGPQYQWAASEVRLRCRLAAGAGNISVFGSLAAIRRENT